MLYLIDDDDRNKLAALMHRLYTERRLSADEMRNAAQLLDGVIDALIPEHPPAMDDD